MADEESGGGAVNVMVVAEEEGNTQSRHQQSSSLPSQSDESAAKNGTHYNGPYTKVKFPGCDAFASWLGRAEVDPVKDASVDAFMGRCCTIQQDDSLDSTKCDDSDVVAAAAASSKHVDYVSADYELFDTPVWRARKRELISKKMDHMKDQCEGRANKLDPTLSYARWKFSYPRNKSTGEEVDVGFVTKGLERIRRYGSRSLVVLIGLVMAMIGFAIITAAQTLHDLKINYAQTFMPDYSKGYGVHVGISLIYIVAAFIPVAYKPIVGGSGIDYAKAMLNGITVPESASLTTLVCKAVGVVFTSAASLPVGIEGPMIHCGLCLGANVWRIIPRSVPMFDTLFSDRSRRDFAAIGTAAGVAAAFMSPIGGILFAMEEGASFWSIQLMWKCVNAATTTMCMWYFLSAAKTGYGFQSIPLKFAPVDDGEVGRVEVKLWEYFLIAAIGMMGGIIGAMFVDFNIRLAKLRRRMALSKPLKLLEVMFFTVLMASLTWFLPLVYSICTDDLVTPEEHYNYIRFNCPEGKYNQLATLLLSSPSTYGLRHTFHANADAFSTQALVIAGCVYLIVLLFLFGASVVMGIFIPLLYAGSCFGRAIALCVGLNPVMYSIVGASSMLCGVVRVVISLTVIVIVESTGLPFMMIPLLIANISARSLANKISKKSIYERLLELKDIPFLEEAPPKALTHRMLHARDIMASTPFVKLPAEIEVAHLVQTLKDCSDRTQFPVQHGELFVGMISQSDLLVLLTHKGLFYSVSEKGSGHQKSRQCITHSDLRKIYPVCPDLEDIESSLSDEDKYRYLDLTPYVQIAPHTFEAHGSAERTYELYRTLGLRSLVIVDKRARPIGEITRRDLYSFQEEEDTEKMKLT